MKTRIFSLALALALCLGLLPTAALAYDPANPPTEEESISHRSLQIPSFEKRNLEEPISLHKAIHSDIEDELYDVDEDDYYCFTTLNSYRAINPETLLTLQNTAPVGTDCYLRAEMDVYEKAGADTPYPGRYNCDDIETYVPFSGSDDFSNQEGRRLYPGQQASFPLHYHHSFSLAHENGSPIVDGSIVILKVYAIYPECTGEDSYNDWGRWWWWSFYIDSTVPAQGNVSVGPGFVTGDGLNILFTQGKKNDAGLSHQVELTNTTDNPIQGSYALLSYHSPTQAQFFFFDLDIAPGQTVIVERNSMFYRLSQAKMLWIAFDSPQEKEAFIKDAPIQGTAAWETGYYSVKFNEGPAFLRDTFGIQ